MPKDTPASELLAKAIEAAGGQGPLAVRLGISQQAVSTWSRRGWAPAARTEALKSIAQGPAAPPAPAPLKRPPPPRAGRGAVPTVGAPTPPPTGMFLTREEVQALTARQRSDAQAHELDLMGVAYKRRTDGSLVVLRALVEQLFGVSAPKPGRTKPPPQIKWD